MKRDGLRNASVNCKVMTVHIVISPVLEIVSLLPLHLKSKDMSLKTSKTCATSLTLKENRQTRL
uniref:Uncharacterized protein n=1 Tax=Magallana gigas TaxID=29159 RepID=K1QYS6_MAGGI